MSALRYASICSGIEAASVAWEPLGWKPVLFSEIEAFPKAVLQHRWRAVDARRTNAARLGVPLWGDFTTLRARHLRRLGIEPPDLLVGGTPCQSFSTAGLRQSLKDGRGNLTLNFVRLVHAINPKWIVWENVPGVLSTDDNAFGHFLGGLVVGAAINHPGGGRKWPDSGLVVGPRRTAAWRILDAQYFGLAQRRRRVFVVSGRAGDGANTAKILFESKGKHWDSPTRGKPNQNTAARSKGGSGIYGGGRSGPIDIAPTLRAHSARSDFESEVFVTSWRITGYGGTYEAGDRLATLTTGTDRCAHLLATSVAMRGREGGGTIECGDELAHALRSSQGGSDKPFALIKSAAPLHIRRLMPVECERLQGFADGYTDVPWRGCPGSPDGPRYKAIGNSMPVPVMRWIGQRIAAVEAESTAEKK